jgi:hypothetical protein
MIRIVSTFILISLTQLAFAQSKPLKRKYRGTYEGEIPAYNAIIGTKEVLVKSQNIKLTIAKDSVFMAIGQYNYSNKYKIQSKTQNIEVHFEREGSMIEEVLILDTQTKNLTRKGLFPQPDAILVRKNKSAKR